MEGLKGPSIFSNFTRAAMPFLDEVDQPLSLITSRLLVKRGP